MHAPQEVAKSPSPFRLRLALRVSTGNKQRSNAVLFSAATTLSSLAPLRSSSLLLSLLSLLNLRLSAVWSILSGADLAALVALAPLSVPPQSGLAKFYFLWTTRTRALASPPTMAFLLTHYYRFYTPLASIERQEKRTEFRHGSNVSRV